MRDIVIEVQRGDGTVETRTLEVLQRMKGISVVDAEHGDCFAASRDPSAAVAALCMWHKWTLLRIVPTPEIPPRRVVLALCPVDADGRVLLDVFPGEESVPVRLSFDILCQLLDRAEQPPTMNTRDPAALRSLLARFTAPVTVTFAWIGRVVDVERIAFDGDAR